MHKVVAEIVRIVYNILYSEGFKERNRMQNKDFTRNRKLKFHELCILIIKGAKRGTQASINAFLSEISKSVQEYSKAAFCKARQKIKPEAFKELFDVTAAHFYTNKYKKHRGYRVCAIDGSDLNLPNTKELLEHFGSENYNNRVQVQAQISCLYDVLNHVILDAYIEPYKTNERKLALAHLDYLNEHRTENELLLMDRGYPSEELLLAMEKNKFKYVMRSNKDNFFREIKAVKSHDEIITRKCKDGNVLTIRVVTVMLSDNKSETLITNIMDESFSNDDFREIYHMRWGIETRYNDLKNKFQLENFSGISLMCIMQDFFATLFLSNLLAYIELDCEKELEEINSSDERQYQYKINTMLAISTLKDNVIQLLITDSKFKQLRLLSKIQSRLLKCLTPVRHNRSFPRAIKHYALKFPHNLKNP